MLGEPDESIEATSGEPLEATPGELRAAVRRAALEVDADAARRRHEVVRRAAGVRGRPGADGMAQLVVDCTATQLATAPACIQRTVIPQIPPGSALPRLDDTWDSARGR